VPKRDTRVRRVRAEVELDGRRWASIEERNLSARNGGGRDIHKRCGRSGRFGGKGGNRDSLREEGG